jgi:hypothetical protein
MEPIRIGNGCGFWGDNLDAPIELVRTGNLHYLTLEYLAELTMSILALQKQRDPTLGFAHDFLDVLQRLVPYLRDQPGLKIVTNAGGMNPSGCAARARAILDQAGLTDRKVAIVEGDDLLPHLDALLNQQGQALANIDTGRPLSEVRDRVVSANAYLGSDVIAEALRQAGVSIVITGRVADAALTVGPAVHAFRWSMQDYQRLGAATAAGHLLECGAQATGGLWCNWEELSDLATVGYPIAEMNADGSFVLTKPVGSGGTVQEETVAEQLLYEVGNPAAYLTPDVTADFTGLQLETVGPDRVHIRGGRSLPPPASYKVSIAYRDGFAASGTLVIAGPGAAIKARRCGQILLQRLQRVGVEPARSHIECLGAGDSLPGVLPVADPPEVVLRVAVHDSRKSVVERFSREFAPLVTSGPPGVTGYTTGRPSVREVFAYWPALVSRDCVTPVVRVV